MGWLRDMFHVIKAAFNDARTEEFRERDGHLYAVKEGQETYLGKYDQAAQTTCRDLGIEVKVGQR